MKSDTLHNGFGLSTGAQSSPNVQPMSEAEIEALADDICNNAPHQPGGLTPNGRAKTCAPIDLVLDARRNIVVNIASCNLRRRHLTSVNDVLKLHGRKERKS